MAYSNLAGGVEALGVVRLLPRRCTGSCHMVSMNTSSVDRPGDQEGGGWLHVRLLQQWLLCPALMQWRLRIKGGGSWVVWLALLVSRR